MKKAARLIVLTGAVFLVGCQSLSPPQIDPAIIESNEMDKALLVNRYHNVHYHSQNFYPSSTYQRSGSFYYRRGYRY